MLISLPSRYEDLDETYRGRLVPNRELLSIINIAQKSMQISGGIRFLPIYGESGAGKSSAARELSTHLPSVKTFILERSEIESRENLVDRVVAEYERNKNKILVGIVDQYEENVASREKIPTQFVEYLSLLDRGEFKKIPVIFIWLTTNKDFQNLLVNATTRNRRILLNDDFTINGPEKEDWPKIIEETFSFHNSEKSLADYGLIESDLMKIGLDSKTLGSAIEKTGIRLSENLDDVQNLSEYQIILMWPVADSLRNQRVMQFSKPREGYKLNWDAWYSELNVEDKIQLPLREFNRTRLYFDLRIVPVRVADLHKLCLNLEEKEIQLADTYIKRFKKTHFYHVVSNTWENYEYNPVRERESQRSRDAEQWYSTITGEPTLLGRRLAKVFNECGFDGVHEKGLTSSYGRVRADVFINRPEMQKNKVLIELKVFSSENTMPSTIKDAIKVTLRRHAQFAGFLQRQ
jgi:ABC-type dipeptide/oligopeptide/nickel transport system ATPase component